MSENLSDDKNLKAILSRLEVLENIDIEKLKEKQQILQFDNTILKTIDVLKEMCRPLKDEVFVQMFWPKLSLSRQEACSTQISGIIDSLQWINNCNINQQNVSNEIRNCEQNIKANYNSLYNFLHEMELSYDVNEIKKAQLPGDEYLKQSKQNAANIAQMEKTARDNLAKTGVSEHAVIFDKQAENYKNNARYWFFGVIGVLVAIGVFAWWFFVKEESLLRLVKYETHVMILLFITRIFILSIFSVALLTSLKNYNANKHLETLNRHRANCMKTFELFVSAASEPSIKNAILTQATDAIFKTGETGYIHKSDSNCASGFNTSSLVLNSRFANQG